MKSQKQIEVEFRALLGDEGQYQALNTFLLEKGQDLGEDDKSVHFFLFPGKMLKVTDNLSQHSAKITMKLNRIGEGSMFEEVEFPIDQADVSKAARIFETMGGQYLIEPVVKRHNYLYKGVELAVKFSQSWGYHVELEIIIADPAEHLAAEKKIQEISEELHLKLMSEEELAAFTKNIEENYKRR